MTTAATPALDIEQLRAHFPALHQEVHGRPLVYLDSAATAQRPRAVVEAEANFYFHDNANVRRGLYELSRRATERYEEARRVVARFIGAETDEVVWVRGTTEAVNLVASAWGNANVRAGDEIVLSVLEHHSNLVPWQLLAERAGARLSFLDIDEQGRLRLDQLDELLTPRTRLVALAHVSNALGTIHPIREIAARVHAAGALLLVDGAQGAPHLPVDVRELGADFYTLSGHKLGGPMGIGVLWARREILEAMPPYHGGGDMIATVTLERSTWAEVPHKFEAGTPNAAGAVGLAAGIEFLERAGRDRLRAHEHDLVVHGLERLRAVEGLKLFGPLDPAERTAVFSFELDGVHPHDVATILDAEAIAVRAGHHCCQPLMRRLDVPATVRASCFVYNTTEEIDRLIEGLASVRAIFG